MNTAKQNAARGGCTVLDGFSKGESDALCVEKLRNRAARREAKRRLNIFR